jgi:hypothetical protein
MTSNGHKPPVDIRSLGVALAQDRGFRQGYAYAYIEIEGKITALEALVRQLAEALQGIEPFIPADDSGPKTTKLAHIEASKAVRRALAAARTILRKEQQE